MTILAENIGELLRRAKRQGDVAEACGVSQPTISRWASGSKPEPEALIALAAYAGVSAEMLVTVPIAKWPSPDREKFKERRRRRGWSSGQLAQEAHAVVLRERATAKVSASAIDEFEAGGGAAAPAWLPFAEMALQEGSAPLEASTEPRDDIVYIRQVDIEFAMGPGTVLDEHAETTLVPYNLNYLKSLSKSPIDKLMLVGGFGDSMEPTLSRHDLLLIDLGKTDITRQDLIWALEYGGGGMVKRLRTLPQERIRIGSDNPAAGPADDVSKADVRIVGKVLLAIRIVQ